MQKARSRPRLLFFGCVGSCQETDSDGNFAQGALCARRTLLVNTDRAFDFSGSPQATTGPGACAGVLGNTSAAAKVSAANPVSTR